MELKTTAAIKAELTERDPQLKVLVDKYGDIEISLATNYFESLASSIVGQQLSNKVADVIWNRLVKLLGGAAGGTLKSVAIKAPSNYKISEEYQITPEAVVAAGAEDLRSVGLSAGKTAYLKNLSQAVIDGSLNLSMLQTLPDEEIITQLTRIKGIGRWTAEMFLIFSLGRQDVFSLGDGGLYNAIRKLYALDAPVKSEIQALTRIWSPHRTFASLYLWKSLDNG